MREWWVNVYANSVLVGRQYVGSRWPSRARAVEMGNWPMVKLRPLYRIHVKLKEAQ